MKVKRIKPKNLKIDKTPVPSMVGVKTPKSSNQFVFTPLSRNIFIEDNKGIFGSSDLTYNESGITYNEVGEIYGGGDRLAGLVPSMISIGRLDTTTQYIIQAGEPMGLLLSLTYPTAGTVN